MEIVREAVDQMAIVALLALCKTTIASSQSTFYVNQSCPLCPSFPSRCFDFTLDCKAFGGKTAASFHITKLMTQRKLRHRRALRYCPGTVKYTFLTYGHNLVLLYRVIFQMKMNQKILTATFKCMQWLLN